MNIRAIEKTLENCPCGREHKITLRAAEIDSGLTGQTGDILQKHGFPKKFLLVSDKSAMAASCGLTEALSASGFTFDQIVYDDMRFAKMETVEELTTACAPFDGILSVGTGSVNDLCRLAAFNAKKAFAIFATAPSMDGFASDSSPIIKNNYKKTYPAAAPSIIIADTKILAKSPAVLKAAGLGDLLAKYVGLADWKISTLLTGEYYCERIVALTKEAVDRAVSLGDNIIKEDETAAAAIMEALVLPGICMQLAGSTRPGSGSEHVVSHFWEDMKLKDGIWPDFHGKKVGVATCLVTSIYHELAKAETINPVKETPDWPKIYDVYGSSFCEEVVKANDPQIMDKVDLEMLKKQWPEIREIIRTTLPSAEEMIAILKKANAATTAPEVTVNETLKNNGLQYSAYMRYRLTLLRMIPTLNIK